MLRTLRVVIITLTAMAVSACVSTSEHQAALDDLAAQRSRAAELDSALSACSSERDTLKGNSDSLTKSNALLAEANAKLMAQMDQSNGDAGFSSKLLDCEMRVRTLESEVTDKDSELQTVRADLEHAEADMDSIETSMDASRKLMQMATERATALQNSIDAGLVKERASGLVSTEIGDGRLLIWIDQDALFKKGAVDLTDDGKLVLTRIAEAMKDRDDIALTIESWADKSARQGKGKGAWDYAATRAAAIANYMDTLPELDVVPLTAKAQAQASELMDSHKRICIFADLASEDDAATEQTP